MKTFKELSEEIEEQYTVLEGKIKVIKAVKNAKTGKIEKKKTFTCDEGKKYNSKSGKCEIISGSEKAARKKGSKKRAITLSKKPQAQKDRDAKKMAKAKAKFGL